MWRRGGSGGGGTGDESCLNTRQDTHAGKKSKQSHGPSLSVHRQSPDLLSLCCSVTSRLSKLFLFNEEVHSALSPDHSNVLRLLKAS
jgi:hypothetical protein